MADNVIADSGAGGATLAMREVTHGGDTAQLAGAWIAGITGAEGSYTFAAINGSAANGLEVDVTRLSALVASSAEIGNVKNSGTFVVQEDGAALTALQLIDNIVLAEDAAHGSGDSGVMALAVRNDASTAFGADGDYSPLSTNESGSLWVHEEPTFIDTGNSSTTPLAGDAVFTGTAISIRDFAAVSIFLDSDQDSATDGLSMQLSSDGTNWDVKRNFSYAAATDGSLYQQGALAEFFRLVYTNGSTPQTTFRLQTLFHHVTPISATHRLADDEDPDAYSTLTKAAIVAQAAGTGDFKPVQSTAAGNLKVSLEESNGDLTGGGTEATAIRVTMASDSTGLLSVDDNGASLTVDNASMDTVAGAVSGSEMQVDVLTSALPTGAATSAAQLADGHNVTVDNAAGAAAVNIQDGGNSITVDGTVTADAGTNLNTSALALETGGNLDTLAGAVAGSEVQSDIITIAAGSNLIADVGLSGARTSGGTTPYKNLDVDETEDAVKASPGQIYWIHAINLTAVPLYLKLYNATVGTVVVGTTVPDLTFPVPANADSDGAGFTLSIPNGIEFGTAITIAGTTGFADADTGAPATNALIVNLGYA